MTPDEPTPDAPSPLHRALRWSLPGAALLLILWASTHVSGEGELFFLAMTFCFAGLTIGTSIKAIRCWSPKRDGLTSALAFLTFFNAAVLVVACVVVLLPVWLISSAHRE